MLESMELEAVPGMSSSGSDIRTGREGHRGCSCGRGRMRLRLRPEVWSPVTVAKWCRQATSVSDL